MLLERLQAFFQSAKHRTGTIGVMSGLSQLVDNLLLPRNTRLKLRDMPLGLGKMLVVHPYRVAQKRRARSREERNFSERVEGVL
jgi:hypothetical protein